MRWLATATLLLTGLSLQAHAQRAVGHAGGGFGGRSSAPSFHGGFSGGSPGASTFSAAPRGMPYRSGQPYGGVPAVRGYGSGARAYPARSYPDRSQFGYATRGGYGSANAVRRPYPQPRPGPRGRNGYGRYENTYVAAYPYGSGAWLTPWELGYPDYDNGLFASDDASQAVGDSYVGAPQEPSPDDYADASAGYPDDTSPYPPEVVQPRAEDAVTLIFKDGRPSQQIRNYMVTKTTLTVIDGHRLRELPVAELDVPATEAANRKMGVAFSIPQ